MTLVSVIVPNYNGARTLPLVLKSIQAQTHQPLEVIVADDGSTDDSVSVAESFGVRVVSTPRNGGAAVARNTGAAVASGSVFFFLDSDVSIEPDAVAQAVALLDGAPELGAVCGIEDPEPLIPGGLVKEFRALQYHYWSISSAGPISFLFSNICAIRASVFAELGPFNPALRYTEEVDYGHRINQRHGMVLSTSIRGRHDHDGVLRILLRKLFHRGRLRIPLYAGARQFASGFETSWRAYAAVVALLAVVSTAVPLVYGLLWIVIPLVLLAASIGFDGGMYQFVLRRKGLLFLVYFVGVQFLVNVTIAASVGAGVLQWLTSRRFRHLYAAPA